MSSFTVAFALSVSSVLALAPPMAAPLEPVHIKGGEAVGPCGWPSVVKITPLSGGGVCSAVLVHPRVLLTAAHCLDEGVDAGVIFGEDIETGPVLANIASCEMYPAWSIDGPEGVDFGYCVLEEPVLSVPIVPVAGGCEQTAILPGARVVQVGFGVDDALQVGVKRMLDTAIAAITPEGEIQVSDPAGIICSGDSGGPLFVYLHPDLGGDGTWRVAGINAWTYVEQLGNHSCIDSSFAGLVSTPIDWVEQDSGFDITPCTDGEDWAPTVYCGGMPTEPWVGSGDYVDGCTSPEIVEFSGVCGPALDASPDDVPPIAVIETPTQAQNVAPQGNQTPVEIRVDATDEGWGVASVALVVREVDTGTEQVDVRDEWSAWTWVVDLSAGAYEVEVMATDHAGNESEVVLRCFGVGEPGCGAGETGTGDDTAGADDLPGGTAGDGGDAADDGASGCGCRASAEDHGGGMGPAWIIIGVLGLARRRRGLPA